MNNIIKFTLSGKYAFFKKPEYYEFVNNAHCYITYNQIPKTFILGLIGAILGYKSFQRDNNFFNKLKNLKIAIIPSQPYFKKMDYKFIDHTGLYFLSKRKNIIFNFSVLVNPQWDIYILNNNFSDFDTLKNYLYKGYSKTHLYLGNTSFFANINNVEEFNNCKNFSNNDEFIQIDSLFNLKNNSILLEETFDEPFLYKEILPYSYDDNFNYIKDTFYLTNQEINIKSIDINNIINVNNKNLFFY